MSASEFANILTLIGPTIAKRDTNYRSAIPIHERLVITMRILAAGDSFNSLMYLFRVSRQIISRIMLDSCLMGNIIVHAPIYSDSEYYNYKGSYSILLFEIVDANYSFI
ncbi:PREDICTED: uncharacterized protein LOC108570345 [Habropoda laboriosa]|uniref:uncharacterized protein LOC108570345 n=1 Tax=Habropoda laboriosa TaxID=597456 RepID=UPI00083E30C9|nr:PREDICTED: uncharacterized protein LOC108570345 [Habropoda laboriosa]